MEQDYARFRIGPKQAIPGFCGQIHMPCAVLDPGPEVTHWRPPLMREDVAFGAFGPRSGGPKRDVGPAVLDAPLGICSPQVLVRIY